MLQTPFGRESTAVREWPLWGQYALSVGAALAAVGVRVALHPVLGDQVPFITVFAVLLPLVVLVRPGAFLAAALVGCVGVWTVVIPPRGSLSLNEPIAVAQLGLVLAAIAAATATAWLSQRAHDRAARSDAMLRAFVDESPVLKLITAPDGRIVYVNRAMTGALGRAAEEIVGRTHAEILPASNAEAALREVDAVRVSGGTRGSIEQIPPREGGGEPRVLEWRRFRLNVEWGRPPLVAELAHDVTDQARATRLLRDSERRLTRHLDGMKWLHETGKVCARAGAKPADCLGAILDAAIRITGADKGNIQVFDGDALVIAVQRGFEPAFLEFFARVGTGHAAACGAAMRSGRRVVIEDVARSELFAGHPAQQVLLDAGIHSIQSVPLVSSTDMVLGVISTHFAHPHLPDERSLRLTDLLARQAADYLERRCAEEALRSREAELEAVIHRTPFMLTRCGRDLRYRFVSDAYARMVGRTPEDIAGRPIADIMGVDGLETIRPHIDRVLRGEVVEYEADVPFAGIGMRHLCVTYCPEVDPSGHVAGWVGSIIDVTERKRPEQTLRDSQDAPVPVVLPRHGSPVAGS